MLLGEAQAAEDRSPVGQWVGTYSCDGVTDDPFELSVSPGASGSLTGVIAFSNPDRSGQLALEGPPAAGEGRFDLAPRAWLQRPAVPRQPVGITGQVLPNATAMTGKLPGCGWSEFSAYRKPGTAQQAEADLPPPAPPGPGGPFEGTWRGAVTCPRGAGTDTFPLSLIVSQQGDAAAALLTESLPDQRPGLPMDKVGVFLSGVVGGGGALNGSALDNRSIPAFPHGVVLDPTSGAVRFALYASRCAASVTRTGAFPPEVATAADGLLGTWALASPAYRDAHPRVGSSMLRNETALLEFGRRGDLLFGRLQAFTPANGPVGQQDRLVVNLRPITAFPDGRVGFVSTDAERAEGAFRPGARGEVAGLSRGFLLVVSPPAPRENELDVSLDAGRGLFHPTEVFVRRGAADSAPMAEGGPPLELPSGLGGRLAAARSLRQQCDVLAAWAKPLTGRPDARTAPVDRLQRDALPLFEDDVFVPVFGLSYAMTTPEQRRPVFGLIDHRCGQQFGMRDLGHYDLYAPFQSQTEGSFAYAAVTAGLFNRRDAVAAVAAARGRLPSIPATDAGLAELATFERQLPEPLNLLTDDERQATATLLADTRQRIANAMLQARVDGIGDLPASEDGFDRLDAMRADLKASSLAADRKNADLAKLADRKRAIAATLAGEAGRAVADAPVSLPGLKDVTAALRRVAELRQRTGDPAPTVSDADPVTERRAAILADAAVQQAFGEAMTQVAHATASPAAVLSAAAAYLRPDEIDVPAGSSPFRMGIDAALQRAEDDHRARVLEAGAANAPRAAGSSEQPTEAATALSGEPAPDDMERAVEDIASGADEAQDDLAGRCARREYQDDPGLALMCLTQVGAGGPMHIHLASFQKIGCAKAVEKPGYICDYAFTLDVAAGRQMGILRDMMASGGNCTGRFVLAGGRWLLRERECN